MRQYEYSPLVEVQGWSEVPRSQPLFDALYVFENYPVERSIQNLGERMGIGATRAIERTTYPLTLIVSPGSKLEVKAIYDKRRYEERMIKQLLRHFSRLLECLSERDAEHVRDLEMLYQNERHQLVDEWNDTRRDYERGNCINDLLEAQATLAPDRVAIVYEDQQVTYGELNRRANQL